ncbi:hypothetical protein TNIN_443831 [Trichonephila inaurata madagascariensis]|uniref:Uncharacterized protein n=1 Tax=Trichonephila inaurata madagascariensis TaxID=2747483 RepID=A0A8X6I5B3_9ARAC|nr:hypothetical protein TNIN_443831 [Trichonephila inaurata madagascariensis]
MSGPRKDPKTPLDLIFFTVSEGAWLIEPPCVYQTDWLLISHFENTPEILMTDLVSWSHGRGMAVCKLTHHFNANFRVSTELIHNCLYTAIICEQV